MTPLRLFLCFICLLPVQAAKTECRVPSVRESDTTTLTCYFPENVSQSKKDFVVYHYSGNERPDPVVDCLWASGNLKCYTKPGYTYDTVISHETSVEIPRLSANQTGKYACQISGSQPEDFEFCELFISPETCELQSQESTAESTLTCIFPENIDQSKKDFAVYHFDDLGRRVVVVDCFWYMDSLSCKTHPGYQSDKKVTDRFEVRILQTSEHQTGSYLCEMSGSRQNYVSICSFPQGGHISQMATDAAQGSSNAAAVVLGILLAIALAVIVCVIIYIKRKHPQALPNITICQNRKKENIQNNDDDGEETKGMVTKRKSKTSADGVRSFFTNAVDRFLRSGNATSTDLEMNAEQAGNISDEQFHRKGKARSLGVETDRVTVKTAGVQVMEKMFDPKPRAVPETSAVTTRQPEHLSDVTVEVEETSDSTNKKKLKFPFFGSKAKNKEKESKRPPGKDKDTAGDSKHAGIHHATKIKSAPADQQSFERTNRDELSRENVGHGQDKAFMTGYEAESSSRREPSEAVKYPEKITHPPEKAASTSAVPKSRTPVSEEIHTADNRKSKLQEEQYRQTEGEVDTRRHSRPVENPPQSRGDKRDPVPAKSSVIVPSGYTGYPGDPGQRQARSSDEYISARGQASSVRTGAKVSDISDTPQEADEPSDKKTSKNKKSIKQDRKESDAKDKSKGGFWSRSSSKKQKEGKASAASLNDTMCEDAEEDDTQARKMSGEHKDNKRTEEKKKKTSGFFSRSPSKKDAKTTAAAAPLLGDKMNENAEETGRTDPRQELKKDSDKRKDSKKKKEKEKTSSKGKA